MSVRGFVVELGAQLFVLEFNLRVQKRKSKVNFNASWDVLSCCWKRAKKEAIDNEPFPKGTQNYKVRS